MHMNKHINQTKLLTGVLSYSTWIQLRTTASQHKTISNLNLQIEANILKVHTKTQDNIMMYDICYSIVVWVLYFGAACI